MASPVFTGTVVNDADGFAPACALPSLYALRAAFPSAPSAELRRFARKKPKQPKDAVNLYDKYLQFRIQSSPTSLAHAHSLLPPFFTWSGGRAKDGTKVIFIELARYDVNVDPKNYVLSLAHLLDESYSREQEGHITVVVDVRGGEGWRNPKPLQVVPFLRLLIPCMRLYPDRLKRAIIYPVPYWSSTLVQLCKRMLDENTANKLYIVGGDDKNLSDCPVAILHEFLTIDNFPRRAWHRHKSLDPVKVAGALGSVEDDAEEFYSASEGSQDNDDDFDIETRPISSNPDVEKEVPTRWHWRVDLMASAHVRLMPLM